MFLLEYQGNFEDLALVFAIDEDEYGKTITYNLHRRQHAQTVAFLTGLQDIIELKWLKLFNSNELQVLLSGDAHGKIDVTDWKYYTKYDRCNAFNKTIQYF